jgi:hypothetical protein
MLAFAQKAGAESPANETPELSDATLLAATGEVLASAAKEESTDPTQERANRVAAPPA